MKKNKSLQVLKQAEILSLLSDMEIEIGSQKMIENVMPLIMALTW